MAIMKLKYQMAVEAVKALGIKADNAAINNWIRNKYSTQTDRTTISCVREVLGGRTTGLAAKKIPGLIGYVRSLEATPTPPAPSRPAPVAPRRTNNVAPRRTNNVVEIVRQIKKIIEDVGGVDNLKEIVEVLK
jgi:hypothetical protein